MKKKKIVFTVTNDLSFDQRMERICSALTSAGYECTLIGRLRKTSRQLDQKPYEQVRIPCLFDAGKFFYLEYNLKLIWTLLFRRFDAVCGIDLDTLLPAFIVGKIKSKHIVYDAHEYFTELEEVINRPFTHKAWSIIEQLCVPRIHYCYTISRGYAELFKQAYGNNFEVIRNVPKKRSIEAHDPVHHFIIYQGALNIGRGLEQSILAMQNLEHTHLKIYGDGPIKEKLKDLIDSNNLRDKVSLFGNVTPEHLHSITPQAQLGLTLFSETGKHHRYSLANRFFDYFHANIPQIAMNYPEYRAFNQEFEVAHLIDDLKPETIAGAIRDLLENHDELIRLRENCESARYACNWQEESKKLVEIYNQMFQ